VAAADTPGTGQQEQVNAHFDAAALYWQAVYDDPRLQGLIYRERQEAVLARIAEFDLPAGAQVLEIGCGAGLLTVELARRGYAVDAVDASEAMVDLTARRARQTGLGAQVRARVADVHALPFQPGSFSLVIAVGLLPWLHEPAQALQEIARVLEAQGGLVLTADNRARLNIWVDPRASLLLVPLKRLRRRLRSAPSGGARSRLYFPSHVNALVQAAGFWLGPGTTLGFGPFSFWSRSLLSDRAGIALHRRLQSLADRGVPLMRSAGWHYLLSAYKQDGN
jgi:SAM-dependent methyltransferase